MSEWEVKYQKIILFPLSVKRKLKGGSILISFSYTKYIDITQLINRKTPTNKSNTGKKDYLQHFTKTSDQYILYSRKIADDAVSKLTAAAAEKSN